MFWAFRIIARQVIRNSPFPRIIFVILCYIRQIRRGARAVEGARLESVCTGNRTQGSNPCLSVFLGCDYRYAWHIRSMAVHILAELGQTEHTFL